MRRLIALLTVASLLIAACGGGGDDNDATKTSASPSATRASATAGTSASPSAASTVSGNVGSTRVSGGSPTSAAASPTSAAATATTRPATKVSTPKPIATQRPTATATSPTGATATSTTGTQAGEDDVKVLDFGFGQVPDSDELGWGFIVENTSQSTIIDSEYQVVAYDASGTILETDDSAIDMLRAGEKRGVGGSIYLPEGATATRIEVQVHTGDAVDNDYDQPFTIEHVQYYGGDFFPKVTGVVTSPYDQPLEDLDVDAVLYDADGKIIGGGFGYADFVLPNVPAGIEAYTGASGEPARVEMYVALSSLSFYSGDTDAPGEQPDVLQDGWGQLPDTSDLGYGFILENTNSDVAIDGLRYQVAAYDASGNVLELSSSYTSVVMPGETTGIGGTMYLPEGTTADHVIVQVLAVNFVQSSAANPFTTDNVNYVDDPFSPSVTGSVHNGASVEINDAEVNVICYNATGEIIGGGTSYLDVIAAGGDSAADVTVSVSEAPASVEMYASVGSLDDLGQ